MVTIGIVRVTQPPLTDMKCFRDELYGNSQVLKYVPSISRKCSRNPGFAIEVTAMLLSTLFSEDLRDTVFIPAKTWSPIPEKTGLVDLIAAGKVNFSVPQLSITHVRSKIIKYVSTPGFFQHGPCFLSCGTGNFVKIPSRGIERRLLGNPALTLGVVLCMGGLFSLRLLQHLRLASPKRGESSAAAVESFLDTIFSNPKEATLAGRLHARMFTTLLALFVLKGFFKSGLISVFSPLRRFPFTTLEELAAELVEGKWTLSVLTNSTSTYRTEIQHVSNYEPIRAALPRSKLEFYGTYKKLQEAFKSNPHLIYFGLLFDVGAFMWRHKRDLDCMCHPLDAPLSEYHGGIGFNFDDTDTYAEVERIMARLDECGILKKLAIKYGLEGERAVLDSRRMLNRGSKELPSWFQLSPDIFERMFFAYFLNLFAAGVICLFEHIFYRQQK